MRRGCYEKDEGNIWYRKLKFSKSSCVEQKSCYESAVNVHLKMGEVCITLCMCCVVDIMNSIAYSEFPNICKL